MPKLDCHSNSLEYSNQYQIDSLSTCGKFQCSKTKLYILFTNKKNLFPQFIGTWFLRYKIDIFLLSKLTIWNKSLVLSYLNECIYKQGKISYLSLAMRNLNCIDKSFLHFLFFIPSFIYTEEEKLENAFLRIMKAFFFLLDIIWWFILFLLFCVKQLLIKTRIHITDGISLLFFSMVITSAMIII